MTTKKIVEAHDKYFLKGHRSGELLETSSTKKTVLFGEGHKQLLKNTARKHGTRL